jgi:tetratricopeptide (TPR) repeat protein
MIYPKEHIVLYQKGIALRNIGENEESLKCFDEVLELEPESEDAKKAKSEILKQL